MTATEQESKFDLNEALSILRATPHVLDALLGQAPLSWLHSREAVDAWSPITVLVHLIHAERTNWIPRARVILSSREIRRFPPFDQLPQQEGAEDRPVAALLDEFRLVREDSLAALHGLALKPQDYDREAEHPVLGPVNLQQLLATWAVHDLNHIHQIVKTLAKNYGDAVGPWKQYLAILDL